jgi:hypothetical protein
MVDRKGITTKPHGAAAEPNMNTWPISGIRMLCEKVLQCIPKGVVNGVPLNTGVDAGKYAVGCNTGVSEYLIQFLGLNGVDLPIANRPYPKSDQKRVRSRLICGLGSEMTEDCSGKKEKKASR